MAKSEDNGLRKAGEGRKSEWVGRKAALSPRGGRMVAVRPEDGTELKCALGASRSKACPRHLLRRSFPALRGKRQPLSRRAGMLAVPSPAKRGKVGRRPGRGQRGVADCGGRMMIWSKIKSCPLQPLRGSFPRCAGAATGIVLAP